MKQAVADAIEEIKRAFPSSELSIIQDDGDGGAHIILENVTIGDKYQPSSTWIGGHITSLYPNSDIYPMFIADVVRRVDGVDFEPPITAGANFLGRPALQVSRRSNRMDLYPLKASEKFRKVLHFLEELQ